MMRKRVKKISMRKVKERREKASITF